MSAKSAGRKPASGVKKPGRKVSFLHKPNCTTCRKARKFLENRGVQLHFRDLGKERLSAAELEKLIGNRDYKGFLNTRNELYREKNMRENPPSRKEAIRLMAREPNLIRRPVVIAGGRVVVGYDENGMARL
ncbi:MAG TPA: Spx/MgsR family RNA polymerase-binding regulatory protein [Candidatus Acidoferrales bacterium]|nr:Spx/MgsR family RNA polymerase-binding regulatory protein [Candidatus Acidoferrales bacterium]